MDLKFFYVQCNQGEVKDSDGQVKYRSDLDELLGMSTTSMDFDVSLSEEFPDLVRMDRQYLTVPVTSVSPERFFSRVGPKR
jgi:hypothetical protein